MSSAPSSFGVTLGRRISSAARATGSIAATSGIELSVAQQFVDRGFGASLGIDLLDDDSAVEVRAGLPVRQRFAGQRAGDDDGIGRHAAEMDLAGVAVDDLGGRADEGAHRQYRALLDDDALDDLAAGADEAIVLDDDRFGLQRFAHAADADAARQVTVLANLRAGADRRPGVDHRATVDIRADIDEAWHQNDVWRDIGRAPHDRTGHGAEAGIAEAVRRPAGEFGGHLVPPFGGAAVGIDRTARDLDHVVETERQQHGLLQPLVDAPPLSRGAAGLLGDAQLAVVHAFERGLDSVAILALGGRRQTLARLPGGIDGGGEFGVNHGGNPGLAEGGADWPGRNAGVNRRRRYWNRIRPAATAPTSQQ